MGHAGQVATDTNVRGARRGRDERCVHRTRLPHWQPHVLPAPAAVPQHPDFSLASQHVDCFAGEQQDEVVPKLVGGFVCVASDREPVG